MPSQETLLLSCLVCNEMHEPDSDDVYQSGEYVVCRNDDCADEFVNGESWSCESCCEVYHSLIRRYHYSNNDITSEHHRNYIAFQIIDHLGWCYSTTINTADGMVICEDCHWMCNNCESSWSSEEESLNCCQDDEYDVSRRDYIMNYSHRPPWKYYYRSTLNHDVTHSYSPHKAAALMRRKPDDVLFIGMELEMEKTSKAVPAFYNAGHDVLAYDGKERFVFFKSDGSLSNSGAELVTHPATFEAFIEMFPWDGLELMHKEGARSFAYHNCGLHFHVSKSSFSPEHLWKFVRFQMRNQDKCIMIAQRDNGQWASWDMSHNFNKLPDVIKGKEFARGRYVAINFTNDSTVELRYFKGNVLPHAIKRNLEFIQSMYEYTKDLTVNQVLRGHLSWERYENYVISNERRFPNLVAFLANYHDSKEED